MQSRQNGWSGTVRVLKVTASLSYSFVPWGSVFLAPGITSCYEVDWPTKETSEPIIITLMIPVNSLSYQSFFYQEPIISILSRYRARDVFSGYESTREFPWPIFEIFIVRPVRLAQSSQTINKPQHKQTKQRKKTITGSYIEVNPFVWLK